MKTIGFYLKSILLAFLESLPVTANGYVLDFRYKIFFRNLLQALKHMQEHIPVKRKLL
jgi:hypothetical protein